MIQTLKISYPSNKIFLWGCFHYDHNPKWEIPLWKQRGFNSISDHNETLINRWNSKVNNDSICFLLGDTCFQATDEVKITNLLNRLNFRRIFLLPGNHISSYKQLYNKILLEKFGEKFGIGKYEVFPLDFQLSESKEVVFLPNYVECYFNNDKVILCHYPLQNWNSYARASIVAHAHCHGNFLRGKPDYYKGGKILEVSVENFPYPPNFYEIMQIMNKKEILFEDHHTSSTQNPF